MTEQFKQESHLEAVRIPQKNVEKLKKKRSQSDKIGRERYNQQLLKRTLAGIEDLRAEIRWARRALIAAGYGKVDESTLQKILVDEVDCLIFDYVKEKGEVGVFPKDVAAWINTQGKYNVRYYDMSRRILRMNKRLHFETGELLFEKRGHKWSLTTVGFDVYR